MRIISGIIRIVTGLVIMGMALFVYITNQEQLAGTNEVTVGIFGQAITAMPNQVIIGLWFAGAIGLMIEMLGMWTLLRKPKPVTNH